MKRGACGCCGPSFNDPSVVRPFGLTVARSRPVVHDEVRRRKAEARLQERFASLARLREAIRPGGSGGPGGVDGLGGGDAGDAEDAECARLGLPGSFLQTRATYIYGKDSGHDVPVTAEGRGAGYNTPPPSRQSRSSPSMVGSRRRRSCPPVAFHDGGNGFSLGVCPARPIPLRAISEQSGSPAEGPGSGSSFRRQDQQQPQRRLAEASSSAHTSSTRRWQRKRASDTALGPLKMADIALYYGKSGRRDRGREGWEDADSKQEGKKDRGEEPRPMEVSTCVVDLDGSSDGDHGHRVDRHRVGDSDSETKEASVTGTAAEARPVRWQGQEQVERQEQDQSVRTRWQGVNVVRKLRQGPQSLYHTQLSRNQQSCTHGDHLCLWQQPQPSHQATVAPRWPSAHTMTLSRCVLW